MTLTARSCLWICTSIELYNSSETSINNTRQTWGVSAVEDALKTGEEVIISVRGTDKYVVMSLKKHPEIHSQYRKTLELLQLNPYHPSLRLHCLQGRLSGLSSVSINISYRIVLELIIEGNEILLVNIGTYDQVY